MCVCVRKNGNEYRKVLGETHKTGSNNDNLTEIGYIVGQGPKRGEVGREKKKKLFSLRA